MTTYGNAELAMTNLKINFRILATNPFIVFSTGKVLTLNSSSIRIFVDDDTMIWSSVATPSSRH
jgi:hypothetical protein